MSVIALESTISQRAGVGARSTRASSPSAELVDVRVKQITAEARTTSIRFLARRYRHRDPSSSLVLRQHHRVRAITVAYMSHQRQRNRQKDALLDADRDNRRRGGDGKVELPWASSLRMSRKPFTLIIPIAIENTIAPTYSARQVLKRAGKEEQHHQHDRSKCPFGARPGCVRRRVQRWRSVSGCR